VAILLQSQRHLVGAIRRKQPLPWECQFSYLTDRHSAGSSRWAQDGVRRQPANCCRSMIPASSPLNGCCTSQAARGPMHITRPERSSSGCDSADGYRIMTGR